MHGEYDAFVLIDFLLFFRQVKHDCKITLQIILQVCVFLSLIDSVLLQKVGSSFNSITLWFHGPSI